MNGIRTILRRLLTLEVFLVAGVFLFSCSAPKVIYKTNTEYRDSVRVEVHERLVHDTVSVEIPKEVEKIVTRDTVSRLENTYAKSEAIVSGGFLHHSLESKPQIVYVPVEVPVADTTTTHVSSAVEVSEETKVEYRDKPLTWLQKTEIYGFRCLLLIALLWFGWKYRKVIISLFRRLFIG